MHLSAFLHAVFGSQSQLSVGNGQVINKNVHAGWKKKGNGRPMAKWNCWCQKMHSYFRIFWKESTVKIINGSCQISPPMDPRITTLNPSYTLMLQSSSSPQRAILPCRGHLSMSGDILLSQFTGWRDRWCGGKDVVKHPTMHRTDSCNKELSTPNVNSAEVETLCSGLMLFKQTPL